MPYQDGRTYKMTFLGTYRAETHEFTRVPLRGPLIRIAEDSIDEYCNIESLPDPLPTTPGSIVTKDGRMYGLTGDQDGKPWADLTGGDGWDFIHTSRLTGATVLFDAGTRREVN